MLHAGSIAFASVAAVDCTGRKTLIIVAKSMIKNRRECYQLPAEPLPDHEFKS
jgi:hypothetical protein